MRKILSVMTVLMSVSLLLVGCGEEKSVVDSNSSVADSSPSVVDSSSSVVDSNPSVVDAYPLVGDNQFGYFRMPEGTECEVDEVLEGLNFMTGGVAVGLAKGEYEIDVEDGSVTLDDGNDFRTYYGIYDVVEYRIEPYYAEYLLPYDVEVISTVMNAAGEGSYEKRWDNALNGYGEEEINYNVPEVYELDSDWAEIEIPKEMVSLEYVYDLICAALNERANESDEDYTVAIDSPSKVVIDGMRGYMFCASIKYSDEEQPDEWIAYLLENAETGAVYFEEMSISSDVSAEEKEIAKACLASFHLSE